MQGIICVRSPAIEQGQIPAGHPAGIPAQAACRSPFHRGAVLLGDVNALAAASVIEASRRKPGSPARTATGGPRIGARYAFSEMNDRWFGWKNLMSSDRRYV